MCPMQWTLSILFCHSVLNKLSTHYSSTQKRIKVNRTVLPGTSGQVALYEACVNGEQVQPGP